MTQTSLRRPALTVATSVYNGARYLPAAIESVLGQSFGDFEFLLLDDGSSDASRSIAEGYAARDARIRVIARANRGLVASLNELFAEARAPLVARFDADDICMPDRFEHQLAFLADNPDHGLVGSATCYIDAEGAPATNPPIERPITNEALLANLKDGPLLCHSAVLVQRDLVREVGGYRSAYTHAEDYDLWLRLSRRTRMHNLPQCLLAYRISDGQVSSRHMVTQARNAAIAWLAHTAVTEGCPDPTEALDTLPPLADLDALFGPGSAAFVRHRVVSRALYAPHTLAGEGWQMLLDHIADVGSDSRLWRLALRLLRAGRPLQAAQAAVKLARHAA